MIVHTVIVTYFAEKWIKGCIDSIIENDPQSKIIIVDNNSTDKTRNILKGFPSLDVVYLSENVGFGQANNIGIKKAILEDTDMVFLLNQDTTIEKNAISILLKASQENPNYGILSPIHLNGTSELYDFNYLRFLCREPDLLRPFFSDLLLGSSQKKQVYESGFVNAAAWMVTRKCLETVGGFHPLFDHYGEDENYIHRLRYHKLKIGIVPKSVINHDREDRFSWDEKEPTYSERLRFIYLELSNLNRCHTGKFTQEISFLTFETFKCFLKVKISLVSANCRLILDILKKRKLIKKLNHVSKNNKYAFLKIKDIT